MTHRTAERRATVRRLLRGPAAATVAALFSATAVAGALTAHVPWWEQVLFAPVLCGTLSLLAVVFAAPSPAAPTRRVRPERGPAAP